MGSFTPNPISRHTNIKLSSNGFKKVLVRCAKLVKFVIKKRYKKPKIKKVAPNCVQKNIR